MQKKFMAKVGQDFTLKARPAAHKSPEERCAVAKDRGYEFTTAEFYQAKTELTDRELHAIAGGYCGGRTYENERMEINCPTPADLV